MKLIDRALESRFWALAVKEINQTLKNKQLLFLLIFTPIIYLIIFGFTFNPDVHGLKLAIIDYDNTAASRELVSAFTENDVFVATHYSNSEQSLSQLVQTGKVTGGLTIPPNFNQYLHQDRTAQIQVLIDGVDANTAGIAQSYITQIINYYNSNLDLNRVPVQIQPLVTFLYNPGLISSWFPVPAALGVVVTLTSSLAATNSVIVEKDAGTLEQLLMTPAAAWEILLAKVVPLFFMLIADVILALCAAQLIFKVPFRGSFLLFLAFSSFYILISAAMGILVATTSPSRLQALLASLFINLPLIQLSGAISPIETMPLLFQYLSLLNPLRHYIAIVRGLLLKGVGIDVLWPNAIALSISAIILLTISVNRFRAVIWK